jgi:hypothetical protein
MSNKSVYECAFCVRSYKSKVYYDRHVSACELLHKSKKHRADELDIISDIPDSRKLYEMVLALAVKNKALEERIDALTKCMDVKKKQVPVKEWLDQNYCGVQTFDSFMSKKTITSCDYTAVCKYDYVEGIIMILKKLFPIELESSLPLKAFDQKENTLFVKNDDGWNIMSNIELEGVVASISKQLMKRFVEWQESNKHRLTEDIYVEEYMSTLQKMLGSNYKSDSILLKIKRGMYKHLRITTNNDL